MALKLLFTFTSIYRVDANSNAQVFEVKHDDTPPYTVRTYKQGSTVQETAGGFESNANTGAVLSSSSYNGSPLQYKAKGEFPYAALYAPPLTLAVASKADVTTPGGGQGSVTLQASGGVAPYTYRATATGGYSSSNVFNGLYAKLWTFEVKDMQGNVASVQVQILQPDSQLLRVACNGFNLQEVLTVGTGGEKWGNVVEENVAECGYTVVYGCTNPEASNYNPNATVDNGSCLLPEKLGAVLPAALAVAGNPLEVVLSSAATGLTPAKAVGAITFGELPEGTVLTVIGQAFAFHLEPQAGEFYNAETLTSALLDNEAITLRYAVTNPNPSQVVLTAINTGSAYSPEITFTEGAPITVEIVAGVDQYRSQTRKQWGCYVEVWACSGSYGEAVDKGTGELLDRFERSYLPSNRYRFDVASTLRLRLEHGLFSEVGRLVPYFVRYGEIYVEEGLTQRKRFPTGESPVRWALDGALPLHQLNDLQAPVLLTRATGIEVPLGLGSYSEALYVLHASGIRLQVEARYLSHTGAPSTETAIDTTPASGGVSRLSLQPVLTRAQALGSMAATLTVKAVLGSATTTLGTLRLQLVPPGKQGRCLVFLSSLSAYETVWLSGVAEAAPKRTPALYGKGVPSVATSSSRAVGVRRVELQRLEKLRSGLLDRDAFDFLTMELSASPEVFLYSAGTYTSCQLVEVEPEADEVEQEYYLSLTVEPGLPHNPIGN